MKRRMIPTIVFLVLLAVPLIGQSRGAVSAEGIGADKQSSNGCQLETTRVIADATTHRLWLLKRNYKRPAAPASLVPLSTESPCAFFLTKACGECSHLKSHGQVVPVIRAGDTLILSEHTAVSDLRVEAVALSAADAGEVMTVRMKAGGRLFHALVTAPGQATLLVRAGEAQP